LSSAAKLDRLFRSALDALKVVEDLKKRGVALHLLDLGGDISGNGLSKLFLTIAAAFAEAERDRIRERIGQVKADQKARGRYLGGKVPFGFRRGDDGELVPYEAEQEAIREIMSLRAQGKALRAIAAAAQAKGHRISHEGVANVLRAVGLAGGSDAILTLKGTTIARSGWSDSGHQEILAACVDKACPIRLWVLNNAIQ
jgi:putative DNA-invertase from lambdoid prophage Rac